MRIGGPEELGRSPPVESRKQTAHQVLLRAPEVLRSKLDYLGNSFQGSDRFQLSYKARLLGVLIR
jgi:hypothetical protein